MSTSMPQSLPADPHAMTVQAAAAALECDPHMGLDADGAAARRARFGRNELSRKAGPAWWKRLAGQFAGVVIWILIGAAIVSGVMGDWLDAAVILAIVLLNGILGFIQEEKAGRSLAALQELSSPAAKVVRQGQWRTIPASELAPGDRIELEAGDRVPADARLIAASGLRVQESALTGESVPVDKNSQSILPPSTPLGDRSNMVYMGTLLTAGNAGALVVATGMKTELGRIAGLLEHQEPEPTPLQKRLEELGRTLLWIVLGAVAVIFMLHLFQGGGLLEVFLLSVSLAVAAVPEGLPAVVTIALAIGLQRMARRKALIRNLPSVETLGAVTLICSDKTGTLTRNQMTVRELLAGPRHYHVTGAGYVPEGAFHPRSPSGREPHERPIDPRGEADLLRALTVAIWCNHARLNQEEESQSEWTLVGDPTEGALLVAAMKAGLDFEGRQSRIVHEIPFDSERKAMSVVVQETDGSLVMHTKGAPEVVLGLCTHEWRDGRRHALDDERRRQILRIAGEMADRALRVLALAEAPGSTRSPAIEENLTFCGLAGMIDPPRQEARAAVARCQTAGIRPIMITGDHPATAAAIAADLGISRPGQSIATGADLDRLDDRQLAGLVPGVSVYARVSAEHKLRIIRAWRSHDQVVAMTGDGVNDAPAIKAADVGIAMGRGGTDVTRQAADMVLADDNFATIVNAVEEGRTIFDNIRKVVHYLLATNAGEVLLMLLAALVAWPTPLFPIHLLWINLVTDALPALALGVEPPEPEVMRRSPRPAKQRVITLRDGARILIHGGLIAICAAAAFWLVYRGDPSRLPQARTVAFFTIAYSQLLVSLSYRSPHHVLFGLGAFTNPWLLGAILVSGLLQSLLAGADLVQSMFKIVDLRAWQWLLIAVVSFIPVSLIELPKLLRWRGSKPDRT